MTTEDDIEVWWKRCGCSRNPGAHTGEESARDGEIKELREALREREALPTLAEILNCYSPDDTVGDYQGKITALFERVT